MSKGYVYVLSNPSMPNLLKIGRCEEGGKKRAKQIYQTGTPTPFTVEFEMLVDDAVWVERAAHEALKRHRVNGSREFFAITVFEAATAILAAYLAAEQMWIAESWDRDAIEALLEAGREVNMDWPDVMAAALHITPESLLEAHKRYLAAAAASAAKIGLQ